MSTRVEGGTVLVVITAHATLSAGPVRLSLSAREDPAPEPGGHNLADATDQRAHYGVAGMTGQMDALRYASVPVRPVRPSGSRAGGRGGAACGAGSSGRTV